MARTIIILLILAAFAPLKAQDHLEVSKLEIKPAGEDYAPVLMDSTIVFASVREHAGLVSIQNQYTGKPTSNLYQVPLSGGHAHLLSATLSSPVNEGPAAFTDHGRTLCYTRNLTVPKKLGQLKGAAAQLGLFFSQRGPSGWEEPVAFEHNSTRYSIIHPTFSPDGNTLIFASDMPGGFGGYDLYRSQRTSSGWSAPENLGITVNSGYHEVYPRWSPKGDLYFASDRPNGLGGLDIYSTVVLDDHAELPLHLPAPINGPGNDHGLVLMPDGRTGFFSSDRDGSDAIHRVRFTVAKFRACEDQVPDNFCYVLRQEPQADIRNLPLDYVWDMGDGTRIVGSTARHCYAREGTYTATSLLVHRQSGVVFRTLKRVPVQVARREQAFITSPDTIRTNRGVLLDTRMAHVPGIQPEEYHWDLGEGVLKTGPSIIHQFRKPGVYEVRLDIIGTSQATGRLDNKCAIKRIVVQDRYRENEDQSVTAVYKDASGNLSVREYQELPHDLFNLVEDEQGNVKLTVELFASKERVSLDDPRFVELRKHYPVIERYDPQRDMYVYTVGETGNMEELYKIHKKVLELNFLGAEVFAIQEEKLIDISRLEMASRKELERTKVRTQAIQFAYKSADIQPGSEAVLDLVAEVLTRHSDLQLVIEAHTDDIGSIAYNLDLSERRARAVVEYLRSKGIDSDRTLPIGFGKNRPIASNKTEAGRQLNRRVEFQLMLPEELQAVGGVRR